MPSQRSFCGTVYQRAGTTASVAFPRSNTDGFDLIGSAQPRHLDASTGLGVQLPTVTHPVASSFDAVLTPRPSNRMTFSRATLDPILSLFSDECCDDVIGDCLDLTSGQRRRMRIARRIGTQILPTEAIG